MGSTYKVVMEFGFIVTVKRAEGLEEVPEDGGDVDLLGKTLGPVGTRRNRPVKKGRVRSGSHFEKSKARPVLFTNRSGLVPSILGQARPVPTLTYNRFGRETIFNYEY